jgi:hypothetical protein
MLIFKDLFNGDEICSDVYPVETVEGCILKVTGKRVTKVQGGDYGIAGDEEDGGVEESSQVQVINVVDAHQLSPTNFDKKNFMTYIKGYMKRLLERIKAKNPERVDAFQKEAQEFVKKVLANFKDYDFYLGPSNDVEAMVVLSTWAEDGVTPYFYFWKDGLEQEKV